VTVGHCPGTAEWKGGGETSEHTAGYFVPVSQAVRGLGVGEGPPETSEVRGLPPQGSPPPPTLSSLQVEKKK